MFCEYCGTKLSEDARFCQSCGEAISHGDSLSAVECFAHISNRLFTAMGVTTVEKFSFKELLADVFKQHTPEDYEEHFLVGTRKTTPPLSGVKCAWPKPWMFFRCFTISIFLYAVFSALLYAFDNLILIPGLTFLGAVAIPVATVIFFFELNVWKNISLFEIGKFILVGGVLSLVITSFFFEFYGDNLSPLSLASAGLIEEPAKLLALIVLTHRKIYHYKLNGLVLGAAVGAGFAIFESMGYSFVYLITSSGSAISALQSTTLLRGVLSPFAHIAWTAVAGAALWRVCNGRPSVGVFLKLRFFSLFAVSVICHMLWNYLAEFYDLWFYLFLPLEGVFIWKLLFSLANEGIQEVSQLHQFAVEENRDLKEVCNE